MDEAGRGPLAGPVVAAAVWIEPAFLEAEAQGLLRHLDDSKRLSRRRREAFHALLTASPAVRFGVGRADVEEIDALNILRATHAAMRKAVERLGSGVDHLLVDGLAVPGLGCASTPIVDGDAQSLLIAAASVIAKVTRDGIMVELDREYPAYGFARHKGYGTPEHLDALRELGPTPWHRRSFRPVRQLEFERKEE